jgi:hypothetical protein
VSAAALKISDELVAKQSLGAFASALLKDISLCSNPDQLEDAGRRLWKAWGVGQVSDGEGAYLQSLIERRRPLRHTTSSATLAGRFAGRLCSRFTPRQRQRSPDRKASRDRRRMLGGSSALPDNLRHHYTEGQRAVLCIVAGDQAHRCLRLSHRQDCGTGGRLSDDCADHFARGAPVAAHQNHGMSAARSQEPTQPDRDHLTGMAHLDTARLVCCTPDRVQFCENGEPHEEQRFKK